MPVRTAEATWNGTLKEGNGHIEFGEFSQPYSFSSRFENGQGTNPEALLGAAHAGCFSMALSQGLVQDGFSPEQINTTAKVYLEKKDGSFGIRTIELVTKAKIPGIDEEKFLQHANAAKENCHVSKALGGVEIKLEAHLQS